MHASNSSFLFQSPIVSSNGLRQGVTIPSDVSSRDTAEYTTGNLCSEEETLIRWIKARVKGSGFRCQFPCVTARKSVCISRCHSSCTDGIVTRTDVIVDDAVTADSTSFVLEYRVSVLSHNDCRYLGTYKAAIVQGIGANGNWLIVSSPIKRACIGIEIDRAKWGTTTRTTCKTKNVFLIIAVFGPDVKGLPRWIPIKGCSDFESRIKDSTICTRCEDLSKTLNLCPSPQTSSASPAQGAAQPVAGDAALERLLAQKHSFPFCAPKYT
jgi:hypothetical protein